MDHCLISLLSTSNSYVRLQAKKRLNIDFNDPKWVFNPQELAFTNHNPSNMLVEPSKIWDLI